MHQKNHGLSLLEMSIVLVVVGLLIGGVLMGQSLVKNSQLQAIASDFGYFKQAIKLFKDKYKSLPGDFSGATDIWGTDSAGCLATTISNTPQRKTCNGNDDGIIGAINPDPKTIDYLDTGSSFESTRAWQHLSNAALISGTYTGAGSNAGVTWWKPGTNIPDGRISKTNGYTISYSSIVTMGSDIVYGGNYGHVIVYGDTSTLPRQVTAEYPGLTGEQAKSIDGKIDDGKPNSGIVRTFLSNSLTPNCTDGNYTTSDYIVAGSNVPTCSLIYITGF